MKHLHYFKDSEYHIQVIKDVFQDIIDKYDMCPYTSHICEDDELDYIIKPTNTSYYQIEVRFISRGPISNNILEETYEDIKEAKDRLESMGYKTGHIGYHKYQNNLSVLFYVNCSDA